MKIHINKLAKFISYNWGFASKNKQELDHWSLRTITIKLASDYSDVKKLCGTERNIFKKVKIVIQNTAKAVWNGLQIKPANKISSLENALKLKNRKGEIYKGISAFPKGAQPTFLITDPNIITAILMHERNEIGEQAMFTGGISVQVAKQIIGNNILTCPEEEHKLLQKFSSIHFTPKVVLNFFPQFLESSSQLIGKWIENDSKDFVTISTDLTIFSAQAVAKNLLGFHGSVPELCKAMHTLLEINQIKRPKLRDCHRYQQALTFIEMAAVEACNSKDRNFLKCMRDAKDENGISKFKMDDVIAMAKMLFFAGQDATASTLIFLVHTLGQPQFIELQEKLYQEFNQGDKNLLTFIQESKTLENLFSEAFRLFPASFAQTRETVQDIVIDNHFFVPKGSLLYLLHYFSLRDSRRWGLNSMIFDPDRYNDATVNAKMHGPFQHFSLGPTICLGRHFVTLLMKTVVMEMIRTSVWKSCPPQPKLEADVVLDLKPHVNIQISKR